MKKQLVIIGLVILLLVVGLSGCNENKKNEKDNANDFDLFVGIWQVDVENSVILDDSYTTSEETWTFLNESESAAKVNPLNYILEINSRDINGEYHNHSCFWELTKMGIYLTTGYDYTYIFSDDNTHLELTTFNEPEYHKYVLDKI